MATHQYDPTQHPEIQQGTALRYLAAFVASAGAMYAAYALSMSKPPLVELIEVLGGAVMFSLVTQAALFFGLDLSRAQIWKSVALVLTIPLFIVTVAFTVWVFASLYDRTMPDPSILSSMSM
jgi:cytochrome o ubiquinol oxidase operon protein cyoD